MRITAGVGAIVIAISVPALAQPGLTWENAAEFIEAEEERGFSGSVLLIRDGEVFLNDGYGLADRERGVANTPDTIYALGSTPIDFTHVAILQLLDRGKIDLDDPITEYFDGFEGDHSAITLEHLRSGRSGLPDFPNDPAIDEDPDHSALPRDAFIERTRRAELLFPPGTGEEHSHWAWGVLAAVVEVASGQSYPEYVREHILKPAGMTRTGFFGEAFPGETVAVGYGPRTWGDVNTPPRWGETSWLVMGSGGMVGTTGDLYAFHCALDDGVLLSERVAKHFPSSGVYVNGDMYGFETVFNYGPGDRVYLNCNSSNPMERGGGYFVEPLADALIELIADRPKARFSIGIGFDRERGADGDVLVAVQVPEGRPAHEAGLREGDILVSANGRAFDVENPLDALRDGIERGIVLELEVRRGEKVVMLPVTPRRIGEVVEE